METIKVGTEEITLGKPRVKHYLNASKVMLEILKRSDELLEAISLGARAEVGEDGNVNPETGLDVIKEFIDFLAELTEDDIARVAAVLLQFEDIDEGVQFIEQAGGVELGWLTEAFAINAETADIGRVVENFRRAVRAVQAQRVTIQGPAGKPVVAD